MGGLVTGAFVACVVVLATLASAVRHHARRPRGVPLEPWSLRSWPVDVVGADGRSSLRGVGLPEPDGAVGTGHAVLALAPAKPDPEAVSVWCSGEHVGYLPGPVAVPLARAMRPVVRPYLPAPEGRPVAATVHACDDALEVRLDGRRVGELGPAEAADLLPLVRRLVGAGLVPVVRGAVHGDPWELGLVLFLPTAEDLDADGAAARSGRDGS